MLNEIIENVVIVILTIICMIAGAWLFLLFLQLLLKMKTGRREEDGLMDLWQTVITPTEEGKDKENTDQ